MRKPLAATLIITLILLPLSFLPVPQTSATPAVQLFAPHEFNVLVVGAGSSHSGYGYFISDLARYGFNVTVLYGGTSDIDYLNNEMSSVLSQYQVVILQGSNYPLPPTKATVNELIHFTDYAGVLISIGDALLWDESSNLPFANTTWKDPNFSFWENRFGLTLLNGSEVRSPAHEVQPSLFLGHWNGTLNRVSTLISGLPASVPYEVYNTDLYHFNTRLNGAAGIYNFTYSTRNWNGVTYYKNSTGAVGVFINTAWIVSSEPDGQVTYGGVRSSNTRSELLARILAYALDRDFDTVIKPQPIATIRLDGVGQPTFSQTYLMASLSNFNATLGVYDITPTVAFTDFLDSPDIGSPIDYWTNYAPQALSQLNGQYREWEYSSSLRYWRDPRSMTQGQIETLIDNIKANYTRLGMDLFSTVIAPNGQWNQTTLDAMTGRNLYSIDILDNYYPDWWNLRVNSSVVVHSGIRMLKDYVVNASIPYLAENFTQTGLDKNSIHSNYFTIRDKVALAVVNGFPSFVYYVQNFRHNKVGTYSLKTVAANLTYEIPDVRFVPLAEAALYFGNKWMRIENMSRSGAVIEFDIDTSAIPSVASIGKGMLWLQVSSNDTIQEVMIGDKQWAYFDEGSIRMPTPDNSAHVRVTLGTSPSPRVASSRFKVVEAYFDGYRMNVSIASVEALNVTVRLFLPLVGPFKSDNWNVFSLEGLWNYNFGSQSRTLRFWSISDGFVNFEVGAFWIVTHTTPFYNSSVIVTANFSALGVGITEVILTYNAGVNWINLTTTQEGELYVATIPTRPFGTTVLYRLFAFTDVSKWLVTGIYSYDVVDENPPEIGTPEWNPSSPDAGQPVFVRVSVSEPENASGVNRVVLYYFLGEDPLGLAQARAIEMSEENVSGTWSAEIPGQAGGSVVTFFVSAYDRAENSVTTSYLRYRVWILPISPLAFILVVGVVVAIGIGVTLYYFRFRKNRQTTARIQATKTAGN